MGILLLKIVCWPFACVAWWCSVIVAFIMWDSKPIAQEKLRDYVLKAKLKK